MQSYGRVFNSFAELHNASTLTKGGQTVVVKDHTVVPANQYALDNIYKDTPKRTTMNYGAVYNDFQELYNAMPADLPPQIDVNQPVQERTISESEEPIQLPEIKYTDDGYGVIQPNGSITPADTNHMSGTSHYSMSPSMQRSIEAQAAIRGTPNRMKQVTPQQREQWAANTAKQQREAQQEEEKRAKENADRQAHIDAGEWTWVENPDPPNPNRRPTSLMYTSSRKSKNRVQGAAGAGPDSRGGQTSGTVGSKGGRISGKGRGSRGRGKWNGTASDLRRVVGK